jgi:hypothetical protein
MRFQFVFEAKDSSSRGGAGPGRALCERLPRSDTGEDTKMESVEMVIKDGSLPGATSTSSPAWPTLA